jgi:copper chaperone CopZ
MSKASAYFTVKNIGGRRGAAELKRELNTLRGVMSVSIDDRFNDVAVDYDTSGVRQEQLKSKLEDLGYHVTRSQFEDHRM